MALVCQKLREVAYFLTQFADLPVCDQQDDGVRHRRIRIFVYISSNRLLMPVFRPDLFALSVVKLTKMRQISDISPFWKLFFQQLCQFYFLEDAKLCHHNFACWIDHDGEW